MSTDDSDNVVRFPRVILPPPASEAPAGPEDAPADDPAPDPAGPEGGESGEGGGPVPQMPPVQDQDMVPPLLLTMPAFEVPEGEDGEDGAFTGPAPDPERSGAGEALATGMALATALGVAAAQGMWHRARQRRAVA
ncbi:hypothetical protein AB0C74_38905, partial [Spirillospora sp. NPDC048832]